MVPAQLSDTYALVRSQAARAAFRVTGGDGPPPQIEVEILSGIHARCGTGFDVSEFTIGSEDTHDLMLIDDCVAGKPIAVSVKRTLLGPVLILTTDRGDVCANGKRIAEENCVQRLPCRLSVGEVEMVVRPRAKPVGTAAGRNERRVAAGLAIAGLAAIALPWPVEHSGAALPVVSMAEKRVVAVPSGADLPVLMADLEERIAGAGIAQYLTVSEGQDATILVSGSLPSGKMGLWQDLQREIDGEIAPGRVLARVGTAPDLANLPAIRVARLGDAPELVLADRRTVTVGDVMVDGWMLDAITAEGFTVSREGERVTVTY